MPEAAQYNVKEICGAIAVLVPVLATFENFTTLGLYSRLLVTAGASLVVLWLVSGYLAQWVNPPPKPLRFGENTGDAASRLKTSRLAMFLICSVLVALTWLQIDRFVMKVIERQSGETVLAYLYAPLPRVEQITLQLPANGKHRCDWDDINRGSRPPLVARQIDWDKPDPILRLDDFVYPQAVSVVCQSSNSIGIHVDPKSTKIFGANKLTYWRIGILVTGGLLCALAIVRITRLSQ